MDKDKDKKLKDDIIGQTISPSFLRFVFLKCERISQAIYMVSSFISDNEPLKWKIRETVLDILSDSSMLYQEENDLFGSSDRNQVSPLFKTTILESISGNFTKILSLWRLALAGNFISEMNFSILQRELSDLREQMRGAISQDGLAKLTTTSLFPTMAETEKKTNEFEARPNYLSDKKDTVRASNYQDKGLSFKPNQKDSSEKESFKSKGQNNQFKTTRKEKIVEFLRGKEWTSIKDISDAIGGCSTKTIQRELSDMVQAGLLKKKGDRRWSRYLAS